jgi:hypothetical protein
MPSDGPGSRTAIAVRCAIVVWLAWCAILTARYVPVWQSPVTLWSHAVERAPWLPRGHINLGKATITAGDRARGLKIATYGYELEQRRFDAARGDRSSPW